MKSLVEFINEVLDPKKYGPNNKFTVGGTTDNRILLFDIDETLLKSVAKVYVYKDGKLVRELTPEQYNFDKLAEGEEYDYSDFRNYDTLMKSIMLPYWNTLKREYRKGTHIGIITARDGIKPIRKFFLAKGIDIKEDLIFAVADTALGLTDKSIEEGKAECVERLYEVGYRTFIFFDDNEANLKSVKALENKLPIKVHTIKA